MLPPESTSPTLRPDEPRALLDRGRQTRSARALGEIVRVRPIGADRLGDFVVFDKRDARGPLDDRRDGFLVGRARRHPVGESVRARRRERRARLRTRAHRPARRRLDADDLGLAPKRVTRGDAAADARALSDRNIENVEVRLLDEEFEGVGRHAADEIAMERRHGVQPARLREPHRLLARRLKVRPVLDQLSALRPHGGVLLVRIAVGNDDGRPRGRSGARRRRGSGRDCREWPRRSP